MRVGEGFFFFGSEREILMYQKKKKRSFTVYFFQLVPLVNVLHTLQLLLFFPSLSLSHFPNSFCLLSLFLHRSLFNYKFFILLFFCLFSTSPREDLFFSSIFSSFLVLWLFTFLMVSTPSIL